MSGMQVYSGLVRVVDGLMINVCPQRALLVLSVVPLGNAHRPEMTLSA